MASAPSFFLVHPKGLLVRKEASSARLLNESELAELGIDLSSAHELQAADGAQAVAAPVPAELQLGEPFAVVGLRELFSALGAEGFALAGRATQIVEWATTHKFCGRCATPTERVLGERCMKCPSCGLTSYPRISPAIIVLIRRGREALLARNARFPGAFFSTLAGFSEVGESLEETLAREVREEVGIEVGHARYFGSQPWPFPHSLMVGFTADYVSGEIKVDGKEIAEARWFAHDALPKIPPPLSIARRLIDAWIQDVS